MFKDVIKLIGTTSTTDAIGDQIMVPTEREVFANKKSVRQSEFYQAAATGLKAELMFELRIVDYADEREIKYEEKFYKINRTFEKNSEILELICQSLID